MHVVLYTNMFVNLISIINIRLNNLLFYIQLFGFLLSINVHAYCQDIAKNSDSSIQTRLIQIGNHKLFISERGDRHANLL